MGQILHQNIYLEINSRCRHTYLLGQKSNDYLEQLFLQDLTLGYGTCLIGNYNNLNILEKIPKKRQQDIVILTDFDTQQKFNPFDFDKLSNNNDQYIQKVLIANSLSYLLLENIATN